MARITEFERGEMDRMQLHDPVDAKYFLNDSDGLKIVQISTCGRENRKDQGKVSQTFQLDEAAAKQLFGILREHFNFK